MISTTTRQEIENYLMSFMTKALDAIKPYSIPPEAFRPARESASDAGIKPFHEALVTEGVLRASDFERSFSTTLGSTFEEAARLIGETRFKISKRSYKLPANIPRVVLDTIDGVISDISNDGMNNRYFEHVETVSRAYRGDTVNRRDLTIDLYLQDQHGNECFFEMKSPKPNKAQSVDAVRKLLTVHGIRGLGPPTVRTFYAMSYNPFGNNTADYVDNVATKYLGIGQITLIGKEFWDFVGGDGTYEELLQIYKAIGLQLGPSVWKKLSAPP